MAGFPKSAYVAGAMILGATGCRTVSAQSDVPAVIVSPSAQSKAAVTQAVSKALGGVPLKIADDALTKTDLLIIEHEQPRDGEGRPLNGRERGRPEQFHLVKLGNQCTLIHARTDRRFPLPAVSCAPFTLRK